MGWRFDSDPSRFLSLSIIAFSESKSKYPLIFNTEMLGDWDVCQKGTARCIKFKDEFRGAIMPSLEKQGAGKFKLSSFQKKFVKIEQADWGTKKRYDDEGRVVAVSDFGRGYDYRAGNFVKGIEDSRNCNQGQYSESGFQDVVIIGDDTRQSINSLSGLLKQASDMVVRINLDGGGGFGSGVVVGTRCNTLLTTAHNFMGLRGSVWVDISIPG